tara:strand:+ start:307 stop:1104 length:798 start_codon:yes stop_codon:yes gene_type:complete
MDILSKWRKNLSTIVNDVEKKIDPIESFIKIGLIVEKTRKELGLSRIDLANRTKITPAVIEAIENAWVHKLPEQAYLISMLDILEIELRIPNKSLRNLIPKTPSIKPKSNKDFIPDLELFYTWKGNLLYIILISSSILSLNYLHKKSIQLEGISLIASSNRAKSSAESDYENRVKNDLAQSISLTNFNSKGAKWIEINSDKLVNIIIKSNKNKTAEINNFKGKLRFKAVTPLTIRTFPPLTTEDLILWEGKKYIPKERNNGIYKF